MAKLHFYPIDITYKFLDGRPVLCLFGKSREGEQIVVLDRHFEPYFYVLLAENALMETVLEKLKSVELAEGRVVKTEIVQRKLNGQTKRFIKVSASSPSAVPRLRELIENWPDVLACYEADVPFTRRYLIDRAITPLALVEAELEDGKERTRARPRIKASAIRQCPEETSLPKLRMLAFDIECYGAIPPDPAKDPIVMIALYGEELAKVLTWKRFDPGPNAKSIEFLDSEAAMLGRFVQLIEECRPELIVGYNSDGFDWPYIKARAERCGVTLTLCQKIRPDQAIVQLNGAVSLDIFKFIRRVISRKLRTTSLMLSSVAEELLGKRKLEVALDQLSRAWDAASPELANYCEYSLRDAQLAYELTEMLLPNLVELVRIVGLPISDINGMSFSQLVEWYLMRKASSFEELAPNRPDSSELRRREAASYKGAFVFEPKPGLFKEIVVFDFRSLYPSIIASHNICPSTLRCACCKDSAPRVPEHQELWFCTKRRGFLSAVVEELIDRRVRVKEVMSRTNNEQQRKILDARQEGLKVLANVFYGYQGFAPARWYSFDCVTAITAYGRHYIKSIIDKAMAAGFEVLYADTDSIFLKLGRSSEADAVAFVDTINAQLPALMELDYEGYYSAALFVPIKAASGREGEGAKKKYALLDKQGAIKIKGFESVRRNWSRLARELQEQVLGLILRERDLEAAIRHVQQTIVLLRAHELPLEKLIINTQLRKTVDSYAAVGPHVAIAQRLIARGTRIGPGTQIKYIVVEGKGRIRDRALLPEEYPGDGRPYDANYYIEHQLLPAVESIFAVLGCSRKRLLGEQTGKDKAQASLAGFMA